MLCLKLALKSGKLEEYKVAKAIIQYALPGLLVTKWPCLRGQSVRTGQKIVRGDKFVFKHSSSQQRLVQGVLVLTLKFEVPQLGIKISKKSQFFFSAAPTAQSSPELKIHIRNVAQDTFSKVL